MTQRNPMNDRYTTEGPKGQTRKSASSLKPKSKAASSVRVVGGEKTPEQKKAERKAQKKAERQKQRELDAKYYNPPSPQFKTWKRVWWVLLIGAIVCTAVSFIGRNTLPQPVGFGILILAYVLIIGAFFVDFSRIRKIRRAYQEEMEAQANSKEGRAAAKAQAKAEKEEAERKYAEAQEAEAQKKAEREERRKSGKGFFGSGFSLKRREEINEAKKAEKAGKAAGEGADEGKDDAQ